MDFLKSFGTSIPPKELSANDTLTPHKEHTADDFPLINSFRRFLFGAKVDFYAKWDKEEVPRASVKDFQWFGVLGKGAFGKVVLAKYKPTKICCAVKVMDKTRIIESKHLERTLTEMKMLITLKFRFIVYMLYVMKDNSFIYFTMPYVTGGEMYNHLRKLGRFNDDQAKFYAVQVCLGLEYLHYLDVLHRDIKPENILIDQRGYLKITDLGFSKIVKGRTYTFCGTPDYLAPEIILNKGYGKAVDWWSYGVLLYEMNSGHTPFHSENLMKMYAKIIKGKYKNSFHFSKNLKHLIKHTLKVNPTKRYGNLKNGVDDIKEHKWFKNINWLGILNYQVIAPYLPRYINEPNCAASAPHKQASLTVAEQDRFKSQFASF